MTGSLRDAAGGKRFSVRRAESADSRKGMAGVPGSAFLALSATASSLGAPPAGAVAPLLGVDRVMDSMRVVTNLLGNCVAVFAVSRWEGALDTARAKRVLDGADPREPDDDDEAADAEAGADALAAGIQAQKAKEVGELKEPAPEAG